jgi:serine O-acetyltransferase
LAEYLSRQLCAFFPDGNDVDLKGIVRDATDRLEICFAPVRLPMYRSDAGSRFDHLHSDQYATFIYLASNVAFRRGELGVAAKLYGLNKALNGLMCMYDTELPPRFLLVHTAGMLLGKATYGDHFVAIHHVTVGTDRGRRPVLGDSVVMYGGSSIVGDCRIGSNVSVAAHAMVRNAAVPSAHVVAGVSPDLVMKPATRALIDEFFRIDR